MGRDDEAPAGPQLRKPQVRAGEAGAVCRIEVRPGVLPDHHAAGAYGGHVVHLVHDIVQPAGGGAQVFVQAAGATFRPGGESAVGDPAFFIRQHRGDAGDIVHLRVHQQLPDEMAVHAPDAGLQHQQDVRVAAGGRLVQGGEAVFRVGFNQGGGEVPPGGAFLQFLQARPAGFRALPVDQRLDPRLRVHVVPQADHLVHRHGVDRSPQARLVLLRGPAAGQQARIQIGMATGGFHLPPGVQHPGNVRDLPRFLAQAEEQIVILAAVEAGAQPAGLPEQGGPDDRQVADIVVADEGLGIPVRLVVRIHVMPAVLRDPVLVGIDDVRVFPGDELRRAPQRIRRQQVVVVQQGDEPALCQGGGRVGVAADAQVSLRADDPEPAVRSRVQHGAGFRARAGAVVQDSLEIAQRLGGEALQHGAEHGGIRVVYRHDDGDQRAGGRMLPLKFQLRGRRQFPRPALVVRAEHALAGDLAQAAQRIGRPVPLHIFPDPGNSVHGASSFHNIIRCLLFRQNPFIFNGFRIDKPGRGQYTVLVFSGQILAFFVGGNVP